MASVFKKTIVIMMALLVAGIFVFHWFSMDKGMPINECLSANCEYAFPQAIPADTGNMLIGMATAMFYMLVAVLALIFCGISTAGLILRGRFSLFKRRPDGFMERLYQWLEILSKTGLNDANFGGAQF